jgi:hypothetical protein
MLGLGGFVLLAVSSAFGELEQAVETTATTAWCAAAASRRSTHGRPAGAGAGPALVRRPVTLLCSSGCGAAGAGVLRAHWSESPRLSRTSGVRYRAGPPGGVRLVGEGRAGVAAVATMLGVGWHT